MTADPTQGPGNDEMSPLDRRLHGTLSPLVKRLGLSVRQQGAIKILIGVPLAIGWFLFQQYLESNSEWLKFLAPGFPGVLALIGIIELSSGIPISRVAASWDSLRGWQRLVLGLLVVITFFALIFMGLYLWLAPSA